MATTTPHPATGSQQDRYVLGRDGVFATLWDSQEHRMVVENATEEHCRKVRDQLAYRDCQEADLAHLLDACDANYIHCATDPDAQVPDSDWTPGGQQ